MTKPGSPLWLTWRGPSWPDRQRPFKGHPGRKHPPGLRTEFGYGPPQRGPLSWERSSRCPSWARGACRVRNSTSFSPELDWSGIQPGLAPTQYRTLSGHPIPTERVPWVTLPNCVLHTGLDQLAGLCRLAGLSHTRFVNGLNLRPSSTRCRSRNIPCLHWKLLRAIMRWNRFHVCAARKQAPVVCKWELKIQTRNR